MDSSSRLSLSQATTATTIGVLNCVLVFISSRERMWVAKRQVDESSSSVSSLMWQRKRLFYRLWFARGVLGIIACLLPLPPMWIGFMLEQKTGVSRSGVIWAASVLVACIAGSMVAERLLYVGFRDTVDRQQLLCTLASALGVVLLVVGELLTLVPDPIAWSVSGCAIHRLSMIAWWYAVTRKEFGSKQFRDRARLTLAGHGIAFACVFLTFLPFFRTGLNRLFWLFSCFFAVELVTTLLALKATYNLWVRGTSRYSMPPPSLPKINMPVQSSARPSTTVDQGDVAVAKVPPAIYRQRNA